MNLANALRICIATVLMGGLVYALMQRHQNAETLRRTSDAQTRLLLSMEDTRTGLLDVFPGSGIIASANRSACEIFGYDDLAGVRVEELIPEEYHKMHGPKILMTAQAFTNPKVSAIRCYAKRRNGEKFPVVIRVHMSQNGVQTFINVADEVTYLDATKPTLQ